MMDVVNRRIGACHGLRYLIGKIQVIIKASFGYFQDHAILAKFIGLIPWEFLNKIIDRGGL